MLRGVHIASEAGFGKGDDVRALNMCFMDLTRCLGEIVWDGSFFTQHLDKGSFEHR
jgi:hypothetical protein